MIYVGIDPGPKTSGMVMVLGENTEAADDAIDNADLLRLIKLQTSSLVVVIEWVECYGRPVGKETFETCRWIGRFQQVALDCGMRVEFIGQTKVRVTLCGSARTKDSHIRQRLIDLYGGSRTAAIGTKKSPGPLYGVKKHAWSALAVVEAWKMNNK